MSVSPTLVDAHLPFHCNLQEGDKMSNPALADTLKQIADKGADAFYNGPIADSIVAAVSYKINAFLTK